MCVIDCHENGVSGKVVNPSTLAGLAMGIYRPEPNIFKVYSSYETDTYREHIVFSNRFVRMARSNNVSWNAGTGVSQYPHSSIRFHYYLRNEDEEIHVACASAWDSEPFMNWKMRRNEKECKDISHELGYPVENIGCIHVTHFYNDDFTSYCVGPYTIVNKTLEGSECVSVTCAFRKADNSKEHQCVQYNMPHCDIFGPEFMESQTEFMWRLAGLSTVYDELVYMLNYVQEHRI